jgi:hypothetical protein
MTNKIETRGAIPNHSYSYFGSWLGEIELLDDKVILKRKGILSHKNREFNDLEFKANETELRQLYRLLYDSGTNSRRANQTMKPILEFYKIKDFRTLAVGEA